MRTDKASRACDGGMSSRGTDPTARRLDLVVVGHANLDRFLTVSSLPGRDRTVPVTGDQTRLGGTAVNVARAAAASGVRTGLVTRVGGDFPEAFLHQLDGEGIDLAGVERVPPSVSSTCFIVEDGRGEQMTLIDQGPMADASAAPVPAGLLGEATWVHLTTADPAFVLKVRDAAHRAGCRVAVDPAQEIHYRWTATRLRRLLDGAEVLFGNRSEIARAVALTRSGGPAGLTDLVPLVVMTDGARGARAFTRTGVVRVGGLRLRRLRQVTGAGDAFRGGFYGGWFRGERLPACLRRGVVSATRWMARGGADSRARRRSLR